MAEWKNKVVIITGASGGIGAAIAAEFARHGCYVVLVGRNERNLENTTEKCLKLGLPKENILRIIADMNNDDEVKSIETKTIKQFGKINILVNNAGFGKFNSLTNMNMKDYDEIMRVNVRSAVLLSHEAIPHLIKTKGNIVNISSVAGRDAMPKMVVYGMSKAALNHFTRCSAIDLAPQGVRINSILPGPIETSFAAVAGIPNEMADKLLKNFAKKHPMGKIGSVEDIAHATLFLASEDACYITGHLLAIDGGGVLNS